MENTQVMQVLEKVTKQRNIGFVIGSILLVSNLLLAGTVVNMKREIILVPGIDREFKLQGTDVSLSYLEEWSRTALVGLLDLTSSNVMHKKSMVLKHTSSSNIQAINNYFVQKAEQHKKFDLTTYFTETKPLEIDPSTLTVKAVGILTIGYGKNHWEDRDAEYLLKFALQSNRLKLQAFTELVKPVITENHQEEVRHEFD